MLRQLHYRSSVAFAFLAAAGLIGCGDDLPKTYPIPGRLVYEDGKPVPGATVVLQSSYKDKAVAARGQVGEDGTFRLTTFADKDGVIEGEHTVTVVALPGGDGEKTVQSPVPAKYTNSETSPLKVTVKPDTPEILIKIERPAKR